MSAQDDVLAAFGELPRKSQTEVETEVEVEAETEAGAKAAVEAEAVVGEVAEAGGVETGAEADDGEQVLTDDQSEASAGEQGSEPGDVLASGAGAPTQPYLDPAAFFAQLQAEAAPKPRRRWPRLVLRYTAALVVVGAVGAGTAYAITLPKRTDVPFLATSSDGRYSFPFLAKPAPPSGEPAAGADGNTAEIHYGDLRQYLLPTPTGAVRNEDGWESVADFEASVSGTDVSDHLYDAGLRRVARRGWTAADGQHTVIELLQFPDHDGAYAVDNMLDAASPAKASAAETVVPQVTIRGFDDETYNLPVHKLDQVNGLPGQMERRVVFQIGDVVAVVTTTAPKGSPDTPTEQVVMLEAEMLR